MLMIEFRSLYFPFFADTYIFPFLTERELTVSLYGVNLP